MERALSKLLKGGRFRNVDPQHSRLMRAIKSGNTRPELLVRSIVHRMGYRYRLHRRDLPGKPDLVLPRYRKVIQVHGCFWHVHDCRLGNKRPARNSRYWEKKREGNRLRDERNHKRLLELGWNVQVIWECETQDEEALVEILAAFLTD